MRMHFSANVKIKEVLLRKVLYIKDRPPVLGFKMTGQARDEGVSVKRCSTLKEFKRRSSVGSPQCICKAEVRGRSGSFIIEVERRVYKLKCWEVRTLQMCE